MSCVQFTSVEDAEGEDYTNYIANDVAKGPRKEGKPD